MNKEALIKAIVEKTQISRKDAEGALNAVIEAASEALSEGDNVKLVGFGTLSVRKRAARNGVNHATGEPLKIKASKSVKFSAGKDLKEKVNAKKKKKRVG